MELRQQLIKDIELLPESVLQAFTLIAREHIALYKKPSVEINNKCRAVYGSGKGMMWIAEDFNAPLDELREYME
ncbi:MAG: DUF2281 domain-containing protein [Oscillospiraceae bacterium]|nr:DUF2281 domain-containing protein [Oscillospiraceae bacterium]